MADLYNSSHTGAEIDQAVSDVQANKQAWSDKLARDGDASEVTAAFTVASERMNIATGDKLAVIFGKIAKWFGSLGSLAFKSKVSKTDLAYDTALSIRKADLAISVPAEAADNGKFLRIVNGKWEAAGAEDISGPTVEFYQQAALAIDGVAGASVDPRPSGTIGTVEVIIASDSGVPDDTLISSVQAALQKAYEIVVDVTVSKPSQQAVNVTAKLKPKPGVTFDEAKAAVTNAVTAYFNGALLGKRFYRAVLGHVIYSTGLIEDYVLSAPGSDLNVRSYQLPVLNAATFTEDMSTLTASGAAVRVANVTAKIKPKSGVAFDEAKAAVTSAVTEYFGSGLAQNLYRSALGEVIYSTGVVENYTLTAPGANLAGDADHVITLGALTLSELAN